jgi:ABC-type nickel/cobalt efflux system permease component RcnA
LPWGHPHGPQPQELAGPGGWWRGLSAIVVVGLRPCSGAILVLVFALAQGLFWAGVASTAASCTFTRPLRTRTSTEQRNLCDARKEAF